MKKAVVVLPVTAQHKELLESRMEAEFRYVLQTEVKREDVLDADIMIGNVPPAWLKDCKHLKLMQLNSAGTDGYTAPGVLPEGCQLANATGAYGLAISEHLLAMTLMLMKKLHLYHAQQQEASWSDGGPVRSVFGSTTLVLGMGDIGSEYAKRMHALGSRIIGIRRTKGEKPDFADVMDTTEHFREYLPEADIIAMSLPGTPATYHIMDREALSLVKPGAILLNVGRGTAIDPQALREALESGRLGGCGIDVTEPEPLPADDPLWKAPNLLITPHVSGGFHLEETLNRIVRIAADNLEAIANGRPIRNEVDFTTGYRKK